MSRTFYIGDTHFGHANILRFEAGARPFASLDEMHAEMAGRWNAAVGEGDLVVHLGDAAFSRAGLELFRQLNGRKQLVMGNHDRFHAQEYLDAGFEGLHGALKDRDILLTHVPVHPSELGGRFQFNVHGHLHSKPSPGPRYFNASCERLGLAPVEHGDMLRLLARQVESHAWMETDGGWSAI